MSETKQEAPTPDEDPFEYRNVGTLHYIMLARIYDLMMLDLQSTNPEAAKKLLDLHAQGFILGPPPAMNGEFLTPLADDKDTGETA